MSEKKEYVEMVSAPVYENIYFEDDKLMGITPSGRIVEIKSGE